jgi:hypothetical protein
MNHKQVCRSCIKRACCAKSYKHELAKFEVIFGNFMLVRTHTNGSHVQTYITKFCYSCGPISIMTTDWKTDDSLSYSRHRHETFVSPKCSHWLGIPLCLPFEGTRRFFPGVKVKKSSWPCCVMKHRDGSYLVRLTVWSESYEEE